MQLIFATQNSNKVKEIEGQLPKDLTIKSLIDLNYTTELEETQSTLEGNALQKARFVYNKYSKACFADDTGLEVEAINSEPGVYSARYAGEDKSFEKNMDLVLKNLEDKNNRTAKFRTVIAFIEDNGTEHILEGVCQGEILKSRRGVKGFGYDPIFQPIGYPLTFAEMTLAQKAKISHRGIAVTKLNELLKDILNK